MGSFLSSQNTRMTKEEMETALNKAKEIASSSPVVVFSKTYCGYCNRVKALLKQLGATYKVLELDTESDGGDIQAALAEWTGQRTVPNVFIGGKHIGGCDSVLEKHHAGQLIPLLNDAGAIANNSAQL
ncbi:glutaredoxin [Trifolium repens]|nr:Glutaredoxin family protein [Trifolium repens]WJX33063.1 glutaredoxin [Trifolium repens]